VSGSCGGRVIDLDPKLIDLAGGDFHTQNPLAAEYGAYAP
jgi:hypothetical protein